MRISDWSSDVCSSDLAKAIAAADRAALLVHDHATALSAIGAAYSLCTTDQARAASFIERALALDPNNAWAWMRAGWMKTMFGQPDDAFGCFERALALSPYDTFPFTVSFGMAPAHGDRPPSPEASALRDQGPRP